MDDMYSIIGTVSVPEERKTELNTYVLELLKVCGIRKVKEIELDGRQIKTVELPKPDKEGVVYFDYSIFERKKREISYYDTKNCTLFSEDRGYMEYGLVMNLIMTMLEAYSEAECYLMKEKDICDVYAYALIIKNLIGVTLRFVHRARYWDMLLFFRKRGYKNIDVWNAHPFGFSYSDMVQTLALFSTELHTPKPKDYIENATDISDMVSGEREYFAYTLFLKGVETEENDTVKEKLKHLLESDFKNRKKLSEGSDGIWSRIAAISLYDLPPCLVRAFADAIEKDFWELWDELAVEAYRDVEGKVTEETLSDEWDISFWKVIEVAPSYGRMEWSSKEEIEEDSEVGNYLKQWVSDYKNITDEQVLGMDVEQVLADILYSLDDIWKLRYCSADFIADFLRNKEEMRYKKLLCLFQKLVDEDLVFFPELTRKQTLQWVSKNICDKERKTRLEAFGSLMVNKRLRYDVFGV